MTDAQTSATTEPSAAQKQRDRIDQFMGFLQDPSRNLPQLLSDSGIDPPRFLAVARRAISNNPDLLACSPASLLKAFINCATDGLLPDGRQAAIVIYNKKGGGKEAQYQSMYQGLLDVAYRSGNFTSIEAHVVYEGDHFDYAKGDHPFIDHKPASRPKGHSKPITHAYAIARTTNGGIFREVFEPDDIRKVNAVSRATNGPGKDWPEEMARKGPLRRMWKFLPKNDAMARIAEHRDAIPDDLIDMEALEQQPRRTLRTGFAPKALTHEPSIPFDAGSPGDDEQVPVEQDQVDDTQSEGARTMPLSDEGTGQENGPSTDPAPEPDLPPDYDIRAWMQLAVDNFPSIDTVAKFDEWSDDPETQVRLARLKAVDAKQHETLMSVGKARRLKLARGG